MKRVSFVRAARLVVPVLQPWPGSGPGVFNEPSFIRMAVGELTVERYTRDNQRAGETDGRRGHNNE